MGDLFVERNYDDDSIYYQIDILMSENTKEYAGKITDVICKYCNLPKGYSKKNVLARILLSHEQEKAITIDCDEGFEVCNEIFQELTNYVPLFMRDNFYKRKEATYTVRKGDD